MARSKWTTTFWALTVWAGGSVRTDASQSRPLGGPSRQELAGDARGRRRTWRLMFEEALRLGKSPSANCSWGSTSTRSLRAGLDAEQVQVDLVADHRLDERRGPSASRPRRSSPSTARRVAGTRPPSRRSTSKPGASSRNGRRRRQRDPRVAPAREALGVDVEQLPRVERAAEPRRVEALDRPVEAPVGLDAAAAVDLAARVGELQILGLCALFGS